MVYDQTLRHTRPHPHCRTEAAADDLRANAALRAGQLAVEAGCGMSARGREADQGQARERLRDVGSADRAADPLDRLTLRLVLLSCVNG